MRLINYPGLFFLISMVFFSCDQAEEFVTFSESDLKIEKTKEVEILYSDSAVVRIRIKAPVLIFHLQASDPFQEFSEGIHIDFFNYFRIISLGYILQYKFIRRQ